MFKTLQCLEQLCIFFKELTQEINTTREQWLVTAVDNSSEISTVILGTLLAGYKIGINYIYH